MSAPIPEIAESERLTPFHHTAIRSDGLTFMNCLMAAAGEIELVRQFDRLYGATIASRKAPIEQMIDNATGKADDDLQAFCRFVWNSIFIRCPDVRK